MLLRSRSISVIGGSAEVPGFCLLLSWTSAGAEVPTLISTWPCGCPKISSTLGLKNIHLVKIRYFTNSALYSLSFTIFHIFFQFMVFSKIRNKNAYSILTMLLSNSSVFWEDVASTILPWLNGMPSWVPSTTGHPLEVDSGFGSSKTLPRCNRQVANKYRGILA